MKLFAKWLNMLFTFLEILSSLLICLGIIFHLQEIPGANESLILGFSALLLISLLRSLTPYYRYYYDQKPIMSERSTLLFRRILYFSLVAFIFGFIFTINNLPGTKEMVWIGSSFLIISIGVAVILIGLRKERFIIFKDALFRVVLIFVLQIITTISISI